MDSTLDFYFDFASPFAYLASTQIEAIARDTKATLRWHPMLLGAIFKQLGTPNVPLFAMPAPKQRLYRLDMLRSAEILDIPFAFPTRFPLNTVRALRCYLVLAEHDESSSHAPSPSASSVPAGPAHAFAHRVFKACWAEDRDPADPETLRTLLDEIGAPADDVIAASTGDRAKQALRTATSAALEAGVFGAPTCIVKGELLFWGHDRLHMVKEALKGWIPPV